MSADVERFYALMNRLAEMPYQGSRLSELSAKVNLPTRGVYFFFEPGEGRHAPKASLRVVRVGTHAVSLNSRSTLWSRLRRHRGTRSGNGSHRSSIFRLHVGAAMLARDAQTHETWGVGSSAPQSVRVNEADLERRVSGYIGQMSVLWVTVPDSAAPTSARAYIERNAIALLSNLREPVDPPSAGWLGNSSSREPIRQSGLWNLNHVADRYDSGFLGVLETHINHIA